MNQLRMMKDVGMRPVCTALRPLRYPHKPAERRTHFTNSPHNQKPQPVTLGLSWMWLATWRLEPTEPTARLLHGRLLSVRVSFGFADLSLHHERRENVERTSRSIVRPLPALQARGGCVPRARMRGDWQKSVHFSQRWR
jgi:hypothetical protein